MRGVVPTTTPQTLRPTSWEHKSRGYVRKSNTPPTMPDLQGYKKWWWGCRPQTGPNTPTTKKRRPGNTNPQTGQHPPVHSLKETVGSALLSHNPPVAVPSAQKGLTSRFGKDTGCNPLAKTTNTTKISNTPKKGGDHSPVSETIYPLNNPTLKAVLVVNRTVDANTPKNKQFIVSYRSISTSKLVTLQCLHS